ncbi:ornithine cyclodeaminase family protein [Azotosporobacter soli]|uniref:ornithine cyclodeaminase family protein n=1 Tax=Azotosporobacter soli TaxID=3055040 RepID=UPI0031FEEC98
MLFLREADIRRVFSMNDAIAAYKKAFQIFSRGGSDVPLRTNIAAPKYEGQMLFMPGYVEELDCAGVKIVSVFPQNSRQGKAVVPATMLLLDATSGEVNCILDGTYVTRLRTGAATGAATAALARADASIGALLGTGGQAQAQLEAMLAVRELTEVRLCGRDYQKTVAFAERMRECLHLKRVTLRAVATAEEAVTGADVVTAVTTATKPVFDGRWLKPGAHVNAIGSYMPTMQEIDALTLQRSGKIFCESKQAALAEAGDFIVPLRAGLISAESISGDIGNLFLGRQAGRETADEITMFKSVGMAVVDIVTAQEIYLRASEAEIGVSFSF